MTFFRNHPRQARSFVGRIEVHRAQVWVRVLLRELSETRADRRAHVRQSYDVWQVIGLVFGPDAWKARQVAMCESHGSVYARNGQYLGVFQMGSAERARFGGSSFDVWDQVRAAYAYFRLAGWSPWECA